MYINLDTFLFALVFIIPMIVWAIWDLTSYTKEIEGRLMGKLDGVDDLITEKMGSKDIKDRKIIPFQKRK